jgi:hypothetical protein
MFSVLFIVASVCSFSYSQIQPGNSDERMQREIAEANATLKSIIKDMSPEEKAVYKKMLEEQNSNSQALYEIQLKKQLKEYDDKGFTAEQKKEAELQIKEAKEMIDKTYKEMIKELDL